MGCWDRSEGILPSGSPGRVLEKITGGLREQARRFLEAGPVTLNC
jgi:hypothetical protein